MLNANISNGEPRGIDVLLRILGWGRTPDFVENVAQNPQSLPPVIIAPIAITFAGEYARLTGEGRIREASRYSIGALALTEYLYSQVGHDRVLFPKVHMQERTTEGGALGISVDPNREYARDQEFYILKKVDDARGRQVVADARHFHQRQHIRNITLESILANIPIGDGNSYLWKRFIPGPNLGDLFRTLDRGILSGSANDRDLLAQLEKELKGIVVKRLEYWQRNAPDLLDQPRDPEAIVREYKTNLVKVLDTFSERTDVKFTADDKFNFVAALDNINWKFMTDRKVVRNLAATYRNMVIATGMINIDYPRFIEQFTQNGGKRRPNIWALERELSFVDWADKYSHPLVDAWEMDLSLEGTAKRSAVRAVSNYYERQKQPFTNEEIALMGIYRAYRKAYLTLTQFVPKILNQLESGQIDEHEYGDKQRRIQMEISHLLAQGNLLLKRWERAIDSPPAPVSVVTGTLARLSDYTTINYKRADPNQ